MELSFSWCPPATAVVAQNGCITHNVTRSFKMSLLSITEHAITTAPEKTAAPVGRPRSPELGSQIRSIVHALREKEMRERENRAQQLAAIRELQRFD